MKGRNPYSSQKRKFSRSFFPTTTKNKNPFHCTHSINFENGFSLKLPSFKHASNYNGVGVGGGQTKEARANIKRTDEYECALKILHIHTYIIEHMLDVK